MPENNETNRYFLSMSAVDSMDLDDLREALADRLSQDYEHDNDLFLEDWEVHCDGLDKAPNN